MKMSSSVQSLIEAKTEEYPQAIAVVDHGHAITYQELNQQSHQLANYLQRQGVGPDCLIGLCMTRSVSLLVGMLGVLKAGGGFVPLDPAYPKERLVFILEDAQISFMLTEDKSLSLLSASLEASMSIICLDRDWPKIAHQTSENLSLPIKPNHLAYVIYTSGSTGRPKGVMIEHQSLLNFSQAASIVYQIKPEDRILQFASVSFDTAIEEIFPTLIQGGTLVFRNDEMLRSISAFLTVCQNLEISILNLPTAFWHRICMTLAENSIAFPASIRQVIIGGERALPHYLTMWQQQVGDSVRLVNSYGPTEGTVTSTVCVLSGPQAVDVSGRLIPIGKPLPNIQTYVLDPDSLQRVEEGEIGELYIGGLGLARGYLNLPVLTDEKFIPNPFSQSEGDRLYKTGDLVRLSPDGNLEYIKRIDHQVKIRGFRVELTEIETALEEFPLVQESVVICREDKPGQKQLVAYVVVKSGSSSAAAIESEVIANWQRIHDDADLNEVINDWPADFNISGWTSSYTGQLIPELEMREWLDQTILRIRALKPKCVLEIGCGTGLILLSLAPHCQQYVGTDISTTALQYMQQQVNHLSLAQVSLKQQGADQLQSLSAHSFDTIIINSVIQYFPSLDYLLRVLEQAIKLGKSDGKIFIGDIRNLDLLEAFSVAAEWQICPDTLSIQRLQEQITQRLTQEQELVLAPALFPALKQRFPQIQRVEVQLKRGHFRNELTQFRYDVTLHLGQSVRPEPSELELNWPQANLTVPRLRQLLLKTAPDALRLRRVPNARLERELQILRGLAQGDRPDTVGELRHRLHHQPLKGIDPEAIWNLEQDLPYDIDLTWGDPTEQPGEFAVLVRRRKAPPVTAVDLVSTSLPQDFSPDSAEIKLTWQGYANRPLECRIRRQLKRQLRDYLQAKLPDYMLPSAFVFLDQMPLTLNGKVDRRSLPKPSTIRLDLPEDFIPPTVGVEQQLAAIWSQVLDIEPIGRHDSFFDLGGDSLMTTQMIGLAEAAFDVILPLLTFFQGPTVAGLAGAIAATKSSNRFPALSDADLMSMDQLTEQAVLDPSITPDAPFQPGSTPCQALFLTGATGFLGSCLLHELLVQTSADIYCLVRAASAESARQKVLHRLQQQQLWQVDFAHRIVIVAGDLAKPCLGLAQAEFEALAARVEAIYHCGAQVNLIYPYSALKPSNVLGTQEVLRLAARIKAKPVHFVSTLDVFEGVVCAGVQQIAEDTDITQGVGIANGYAQSKWVAERLVAIAATRGIPACIYRPGMISGHSQTGIANTDDLVCRLIKGFIQSGKIPDLDLRIDLTPVDYVSQAIVALAGQPQSLGKAFHLVNPRPLPLAELVQVLSAVGIQVEKVDYSHWQRQLLDTATGPQDHALYALIPALTQATPNPELTCLELWLSGGNLFDMQNATKGLQAISLSCPLANAQLLTRYLKYFSDSDFLTFPIQPLGESVSERLATGA